ncbi:MAG TPA: inositol monophosphatase family protein [Xanthomonadales bacterium]|nr:inositol monophosphatase family protein [Xanthomonadales bacterium]
MKHFLETALEAVSAASIPIIEHFHGSFEVEMKSDQTPVTIADREAEQAIRSVLRDAFPDHGIWGEEYGASDRESDYLWLIDPVDGTKSFVRGYGMFSTQLALLHKGRIVLGVSNAPLMGELAWATLDGGAWLEGQRMRVSAIAELEQATVSTGNLATLARSERWPALGEILAGANRSRGYGDFYHYHRLAQGQLDAVIESDVNVLDIAALSLIVTEAGGVFTDLEGQPVGMETRSVLAATPGLHAGLLQALSQ